MKYPALLLMLALLTLTGCVLAPPAVPIAPPPTRTMAPSATAPANQVRPEQITAENAHKMSQALADELDREAQRNIAVTPLPKN